MKQEHIFVFSQAKERIQDYQEWYSGRRSPLILKKDNYTSG